MSKNEFVMKNQCSECDSFNRLLRVCTQNNVWIDMNNVCALYKSNTSVEG